MVKSSYKLKKKIVGVKIETEKSHQPSRIPIPSTIRDRSAIPSR